MFDTINKSMLGVMFDKLNSYDEITPKNVVEYLHLKKEFINGLNEVHSLILEEDKLRDNIVKMKHDIFNIIWVSSEVFSEKFNKRIRLIEKKHYVNLQYHSYILNIYSQVYFTLYGEMLTQGIPSYNEIEEGLTLNYPFITEEEFSALNEEVNKKIKKYESCAYLRFKE
jgi:hypothetical protein